jgi:hypothetical protein
MWRADQPRADQPRADQPQDLDDEARKSALDEFKESLTARFFVRFHMTLILSAVCLSGVVASKLLLSLGVNSILFRYPLAVVLSYIVFFLLIRLWLWYVSQSRPVGNKQPDDSSIDVDSGQVDVIDVVSTAADGPGVPSVEPGFGGGGDFGGGGATDYWGDTVPAVAPRSSASVSTGGSGKGSSGGWFDFGLDDEGIVIVLILFGVLLVAIFGAGAWLVWEAPAILSEAAFEALLVSGLLKATKRIDRRGWMGSIFFATFLPFAIVLAMTVIFSAAVHHYFPDAVKLADIFNGSLSQEVR